MYHHIAMLLSSNEASLNLFYLLLLKLAKNYIPLLIQLIYLTADFLGREKHKKQVKAVLPCLS